MTRRPEVLMPVTAVVVTAAAFALIPTYTDATVAWLHRPQDYVSAVLGPAETAPVGGEAAP